MNKIIIVLTVLNILVMNMNAQELKIRDKTNPIQLTDKLSIYQEAYKDKGVIYWSLYLDKKGENKPKLLDDYKRRSLTEKATTDFEKLMEDEDYMFYPNLIDAYMEGKYLYVFIYKDYKAMLEIYYFKDGVKFEKTGYLLCPIESGSVMNFGLYSYAVKIKEIGEFHYVDYYASRGSSFKEGLLRIKENNVSKIKINEVTDNTIAYPYIIKELDTDISEGEKKDILFKEFKKQLKDNNMLSKNTLIHSAGYIYIKYAYYIFYKTTDCPNKINLVKYGDYFIKNKPYWGWVFCDYTEEALAPEYSHWNPK